jgi:hypothetical protein
MTIKSAVTWGAAVAMLALSGCMAVPRTIAKGESVAFVEEPLGHARTDIELTNAAIARGARAGGGSGMILGAALGLGCGPWFFICSPFYAATFAAGGALMGAGVGVAQGLPADVHAQLQARIEAFSRDNNVREQALVAIVERGRGHWVPASASESAALVRVRIERVALYSDAAGRVGLSMRIEVATHPDHSRTEVKQTFDYTGVSSEPRLWIEDPDGFVTKSFRHGYADLAQNVFAYLAK